MTIPARPWIAGAALAGCALFLVDPWQGYGLLAVMLFSPLLDTHWRPPPIRPSTAALSAWGGIVAVGLGLILLRPGRTDFAMATFAFAAIPEEWFFRSYFMVRHGTGWRANLITSALFALLHGITGGPLLAVKVLVPSLMFGWIYQRSGDLILVILVHGLSNLLYHYYLGPQLGL